MLLNQLLPLCISSVLNNIDSGERICNADIIQYSFPTIRLIVILLIEEPPFLLQSIIKIITEFKSLLSQFNPSFNETVILQWSLRKRGSWQGRLQTNPTYSDQRSENLLISEATFWLIPQMYPWNVTGLVEGGTGGGLHLSSWSFWLGFFTCDWN